MRTVRGETRTTIVEVAARLLSERGVAAVTIRAVAQAAGLQPPAIYRFFADKDALLDVVAEHVFTTYVAGKSPDEAGDPVADLRAGWDAHITFGLANAALFGLLVDPRRAGASPAAAAGLAILRARVRRVAATGRLRVTERHAVELVHAAGTGAVLTLLAVPPEQREPGLADTMYQAVLHTILVDAPAADAVGPDLAKLTAAERALLDEWLARPG
jgi:AcrR family transcriptional regulator